MAFNLEIMAAELIDIDVAIDWLRKQRQVDDRPFLQLPLPQPPLEEIPTVKEDLPVEPRGVITFDF